MSNFDKYDKAGAYHWRQTDRRWGNSSLNPPLLARYEIMLRLLPPEARKILEVGCGDGYLLYLLGHRDKQALLFGTDGDPTGIALARNELRRRGKPARLALGLAEKLPFGADSMDAICLADVIEHLERPQDALAEIQRVARPGGTIAISTPHRHPDGPWDARHVHEYDARELRALLQDFFRDVWIGGGWPLAWTRRYQRSPGWRRAIRNLCRLRLNPFHHLHSPASSADAMLFARCAR